MKKNYNKVLFLLPVRTMAAHHQLTVILSIVLLSALLSVSPAGGCSCPLRHPQQHYCEADFVANVKVRRVITLPGSQTVLKVRIRRLHKTTPKATAALNKKLIYTIPGTCSLNITGRSMHVITGDIQAGKPWTSACHFAAPWGSLAPRMKKGFRKLYSKGCDCPILSCHWWESRCPTASFFCSWRTSAEDQDCQTQHGVCTRKTPGGGCSWLGGRVYRNCMKKWRTVQRGDHPQRKQENVATLIHSEDSSNDITSNDVIPVVEDIDILPAVLNAKEESGSRRHHAPTGLDSRTTYSIGPRTANSRFNKPRKPGSHFSPYTSNRSKPVKNRNSILGATYSSRTSDSVGYEENKNINANKENIHHNNRVIPNKNKEYYSNTLSSDIDSIPSDPIHYISNHINDLQPDDNDEKADNNIDFSSILTQRRKYPEYTTRIGYIPD